MRQTAMRTKMDSSQTYKRAYEADQEKIQRQYQQAIEQRMRLAELKNRQQELAPKPELQIEIAQLSDDLRRAG